MSAHVINATDANFESEVMKSETPVLVDFWAPWCGPCKMIGPLIDELAGEYAGKLKVVKVNVDENPETPGKHGVRGIPTLLMVKNGDVAATKVGAMSKAQLQAFVEEHL